MDQKLAEALAELLPHPPTGDLAADCLEAARETWRRRQRNGQVGGVVLAALQDPAVMGDRTLSLRQIEDATGIPRSTISRWSAPPA